MREHQQDRERAHRLGDDRNRVGAPFVEPVQVLDDQYRRTRAGQLHDERLQRLEDLGASFLRMERRDSRIAGINPEQPA